MKDNEAKLKELVSIIQSNLFSDEVRDSLIHALAEYSYMHSLHKAEVNNLIIEAFVKGYGIADESARLPDNRPHLYLLRSQVLNAIFPGVVREHKMLEAAKQKIPYKEMRKIVFDN